MSENEAESESASAPIQEGIQVGKTNYIRADIWHSDKSGKDYANIRMWVASKTYSGPTKKGIMVPLDKVQDLIAMLDDLVSGKQ
jgi:hypothetical protein